MKRRLIAFVFIFYFLLYFFTARLFAESGVSLQNSEPNISLDFQDAGLKDALKVFSMQSGLNFIASEGVQERKITLYLDNVPLRKAMDKLFKANNLSYDLDTDSNIFIVKDWGKLETETITKVFYLKYATVSSSSLKEEMYNQMNESSDFSTDSSSSSSSTSSGGGSGKWKVEENSGITEAVKKLLSASGSVIEDFRTNSLIVTDTPDRMAVVEKVIASLDIIVPQVLLEVEMLDVSKNVVDQLGFDFGTSPFTAIITGATASMGFPYASWGKFFNKGLGNLSINPSGNPYSVTLDYLRTQTDTKFLARPKLFTLNNETAEIRIASNESIGIKTITTATTGTTSAEPERSQTGIILRVTPQINMDTGEITMFVYPKVAEAVAGNTLTSGSENFTFRDPEERSTKSIVRVKDGETVVLGGLIRNEITANSSKLPILGDLPIIGMLFRHKGGTADKNKQRELLVFITPHIVKDKPEAKLAKIKNIELPLREQNAVNYSNRDYLIKSSLNNFDKKR